MCKSEYRKPVTLPCGDTICKQCIRKYGEKKIFKCESCVKYFNFKYLDFAVNKKLRLLIPAYKSLMNTQIQNEAQIQSLNQELSQLKLSVSIQKKSFEQELTDLKALLDSANSQINSQKAEISELNSLLLASNNAKDQLEAEMHEQKLEFENQKKNLEMKKETLEDLQLTLMTEQRRLVETEKKLESKIQETIKFCNDKHNELNVKAREIELKELLCDRKEKKRIEAEQLCGELSKELEVVLKWRKVNKVCENDEVRVRSELRPVKNSKLVSSSRHKSTRSSIASGL